MKYKDLINEIRDKIESIDDTEKQEFLLRLSSMTILILRKSHGEDYVNKLLDSFKTSSYERKSNMKSVMDHLK